MHASKKAAAISAASSGMSYGIGQASLPTWQAALAHGTAQGFISVAQGGKFGHGFASAFVSKMANVNKIQGDYKMTRVMTAAVIGGTSSVITGGKFVNGAVTAAYVQLLNGETEKPEDFGESYKGKRTFLAEDEEGWLMGFERDVIDKNEVISVPVIGVKSDKFNVSISIVDIGILDITTAEFEVIGQRMVEYYYPEYISSNGSAYDLPAPVPTGRYHNQDYVTQRNRVVGSESNHFGWSYKYNLTNQKVVFGD